MNVKQVDARGLSCPQPVVLTQKAIKEGNDKIEVIVNNVVSKENVMRTVNNYGMKSEIREVGDDFIITITK